MSFLALVPEAIEGLIAAGQAISSAEYLTDAGKRLTGYQSPEERRQEIGIIKYNIPTADDLFESANRYRFSFPNVDQISSPNFQQSGFPKVIDEEPKMAGVVPGKVMGSGREFYSGYVAPKPKIGVTIYKNTTSPSYTTMSAGNPALGTNGFNTRGLHKIPVSNFGFHDFHRNEREKIPMRAPVVHNNVRTVMAQKRNSSTETKAFTRSNLDDKKRTKAEKEKKRYKKCKKLIKESETAKNM